MPSISIYNKANDTTSTKTIPIDIFYDWIKEGKWQDAVLKIRTCEWDSEEQERLKKSCPGVTFAGTFSSRNDSSLIEHSGRISVDFDYIDDPEAFKEQLKYDKYVEAAFVSLRGRGVCVICKVNPEKHREAHQGLSQYFFETYKKVCDPTSINVSRLRFVSFDPNIYINPNKVERFTKYPKTKPPKRVDKAIYAPDDFKYVLEQLVSRRINIVEDYHNWLRIGFGLVHQFGAAGEDYFHTISQFSAKYNPDQCSRQYKACLKHKGSNEATIAMFYYYCKEAGLEIYSERTKKIAYSASQGKKSGLNAEQVAENLEKFEGITGAQDIIRQVMDNNIDLDEDTLLDQVEIWLRQSFDLRRNAITRFIENNGVPVKQKDLNTIFIKAKKLFDKLTYDLLERLINSDFIPEYNPFMEFFEANKDIKPTGCIEKLFSTIKNRDPKYLEYFGKKWLVGIISAMHEDHSPLVLVLTGYKHGTGKTEWFRRLLPKELKPYYAESKLDAGKDDDILMTQKILIMDDEMGGKSKKEAKRLKELTSKQYFSLREPYGRNNVDLLRLAVLCGTTNENEILYDPTGNRRIIPVIVESIDKELYNTIDKTELLMEAYWLYKSGFDYRVIDDEDVKYLRQDEGLFEMSVAESELILKYFELPEVGAPASRMTATEIKVELEDLSRQKLIMDRISKELKRLGFQQEHTRVGRTTRRDYLVVKINRMANNATETFKGKEEDDLPF